jgi:hypothetical protein
MKPITRRQFLQRAAFASTALCGASHARSAAAEASWAARSKDAGLDPIAIRRLSARIRGHVIVPGDSAYESARLVFNRAFDRRPALIVRCAGASDVARAIAFGRDQRIPLAVRSGGHNAAGLSMCDGGIVIDLSGMKQ